VCLELVRVLVTRHYQPLAFVAYGSISVLFVTFRNLEIALYSLVSVLRLYHTLLRFPCPMPPLPSDAAPTPLTLSAAAMGRSEEEFLDFCSFGKLHLLNHNLGVDDGDEEEVGADDEVAAVLSQSAWVDNAATAKGKEESSSTTALVDEKQVEEWLKSREAKPGQAARRKQKRAEAEAEVPSNSFFSELEQRERQSKKQIVEAKKSKKKTSVGGKAVPSKQNFLDMLRKK
jgi:hypothetical protein